MTPNIQAFILSVGEIITAILVIMGFLKKARKKAETMLLTDIRKDIEKINDDLKVEISNVKSDVKNEIVSLKEDAVERKLSLLRLEILTLIATDPTNHDTIYETYDEYKSLGGNHYIESVIRKWEKSQDLK